MRHPPDGGTLEGGSVTAGAGALAEPEAAADAPLDPARGASEPLLAARLFDLIEARHRDPRVDVAWLARELHTSRRHLYRAVNGTGVAALLSHRRIETARALLIQHPGLTIGQVAERSGFSRRQLREQFVRETGCTPKEYRQRIARDIAAAESEGVG